MRRPYNAKGKFSLAVDNLSTFFCRADRNPFNSQTEQRFLAVEVDMALASNKGVHPGDIYALQGDDIVVIRCDAT